MVLSSLKERKMIEKEGRKEGRKRIEKKGRKEKGKRRKRKMKSTENYPVRPRGNKLW